MSTVEPRGDLADQADASILAAERAAIDAVRRARARRLAEQTDPDSSRSRPDATSSLPGDSRGPTS